MVTPVDFTRVDADEVPETATQHMVAMRDGVRLATDVYLPETAGRLPAILVRLPYDKNSRYVFFEHVAKRATARGYAMVVQDVRGKFRSEGVTLGWVHEANDGYDTIDWVSKQPWSNGVVGMFGDSYYGFTQWAAVSSSHPALRAIVPRVTSANLGTPVETFDSVRDIDWLVLGNYMSHFWLDRYIYDFELDWSIRPLMDVFEPAYKAIGGRSATLDMMAPRLLPVPIYPDGHPFDARPLPVLHAVGWFDNVAIPSMRDFMALLPRPRELPPFPGADLGDRRPQCGPARARSHASRLYRSRTRLLRCVPQGHAPCGLVAPGAVAPGSCGVPRINPVASRGSGGAAPVLGRSVVGRPSWRSPRIR
jgi:hypothetical protein